MHWLNVIGGQPQKHQDVGSLELLGHLASPLNLMGVTERRKHTASLGLRLAWMRNKDLVDVCVGGKHG